jgi:hypothetical protein
MMTVGDLVINRNELSLSFEPRYNARVMANVSIIPRNSLGVVVSVECGSTNDMAIVFFRGHLLGLYENALKVIHRIDE